jgi:hypothetical protein
MKYVEMGKLNNPAERRILYPNLALGYNILD